MKHLMRIADCGLRIFIAAAIVISANGCASTEALFSKTSTPKEKALAAIDLAETGLKFSVGPGIVTWLSLEKDPAIRAQDAAWGFAACSALNSAATGAIVTPDQLKAQIALFTKDNARYQLLAQTMVDSYANIFGSFQLAQTSPAKFLSEIATLGQAAFQQFLATPAVPAASPVADISKESWKAGIYSRRGYNFNG